MILDDSVITLSHTLYSDNSICNRYIKLVKHEIDKVVWQILQKSILKFSLVFKYFL